MVFFLKLNEGGVWIISHKRCSEAWSDAEDGVEVFSVFCLFTRWIFCGVIFWRYMKPNKTAWFKLQNGSMSGTYTSNIILARSFPWLNKKDKLIFQPFFVMVTLPETNSSPLKIGHPKRKVVFQSSIFRCELLVSGRVCLAFRNGIV